ncbi:MAG: intermembrane phospholipid transport protein YdbH family protein [Gammaproteobacteria bacterium]
MTAEQAAPIGNERPGKWFTKIRLSLAVLFLAIWGAVGIYLFRQPLMAWGQENLLRSTSLTFPHISGISLGLKRAELRDVRFDLQTGSTSASVQLQNVSFSYDLKTARLDSVNIARATLNLNYRQDDKASSGGNDEPESVSESMIELPIRKATIHVLELESDSPWGKIIFSGSAEFVNGPDKFQIVFRESPQRLRLNLDNDLDGAELSVEQVDGSPIAKLDYRRTDKNRVQAKLDANFLALLNWLTSTTLIPSTVRTDLIGSPLFQIGPELDKIGLDLQARSNDGFSTLKGRLLLTRDSHYLSSAELTFNTPKSRLTVDGHLDMGLAELLAVAKPWLPAKSQAWLVSSGNLMGSYRFKWQPGQDLAGEAYLRAYELGGSVGPVKIRNGFARLDIKRMTPITAALETELPNVQLGKKTELHDVTVKTELEGQWISVKQAELPVFGGVLALLPTRLDLEKRPLNLTVSVRNLDLSQLLNSLDYPELSGTGLISGKLPLRLTEDSIEVRDGILNGMRPGILRYSGTGLDESNIAFKALQDLRYHSLQGKLDYQPSGDYRLGLRLEGKNPELLSGHLVAFNLNLSGHLPDLLQKGLMTGDFERPILEQVKTNGKP